MAGLRPVRIQGLPIPAELGGGGSDILTTVLVMEALGYGYQDNGLIFSLNAQMWSIELPLVKFGTPAQQQEYLPGFGVGRPDRGARDDRA